MPATVEQVLGSRRGGDPIDQRLTPIVELLRMIGETKEQAQSAEYPPELLMRVRHVPLDAILEAELGIDMESLFGTEARPVISGVTVNPPMYLSLGSRRLLERSESLPSKERLAMALRLVTLCELLFTRTQHAVEGRFDLDALGEGTASFALENQRQFHWSLIVARGVLTNELVRPIIEQMRAEAEELGGDPLAADRALAEIRAVLEWQNHTARRFLRDDKPISELRFQPVANTVRDALEAN